MELEINDSSINSFIIEGLSREAPLIDIFVLLIKQLKGIKKITISHDPINYNSSECQCQVDFLNHEYLSMAKSTLKSPNLLNNLFNERDKKIKIKECKKLHNNLIDETVNKTTALMFENMQIDHTNILEFIFRLKEYINNNKANNDDNNNYKISKIRQYNNRLLVLFDYVPTCIQRLVRKGENEYSQEEIPYYNYKGKNIPIIPKMRPITNIGKYKERNVKISVHCLKEEDKEQILKILENISEKKENLENSEIEEMAQKAYNNVVNREKNLKEEKMKKNLMMKKREREKEKSNEREKEKERQRDRERNRERDKERKKDRERKRDKEREYDKRNQKERDIHSYERKMDNINNINPNNNTSINNNIIRDDNSNTTTNNNSNNIMMNNNINSNINGLNINEKDLNQVASLFSNTNAMNIVKYLLENNMFNNISNNSNNNNNNNSNLIPQKENNNNMMKNNYNENFNNMYNQNNLNNMNNQQLMNLLQTQGNIMNKPNQQQQRMNNMYGGNNMGNNFQNMMNLNNMMNMDNNMLNHKFFNNQRQFQFPMNEQFMNQFAGFNKRKDNNNK